MRSPIKESISYFRAGSPAAQETCIDPFFAPPNIAESVSDAFLLDLQISFGLSGNAGKLN